MKLTEIVVKPVEPPKRVLLDLSQEEAGIVWYFVNYYASTAAADTGPTGLACPAAAAARLAESLKQYRDKYAYPYDYFHEEK